MFFEFAESLVEGGLHSADTDKEFEYFLENPEKVDKEVIEDYIPFITHLLRDYIPYEDLNKGIIRWSLYSSILMKKHDILLKKILNDKKELRSDFFLGLSSTHGRTFANGTILFFEKQYDAMISDIKRLGALSGNQK